MYDNLFRFLYSASGKEQVWTAFSRVVSFDKSALLRIGIFVVFFSLLLILFGLRQSHRIAGPIVQIKSALAAMIHNRFDRSINFRKNDYFPVVAQMLNRAMKTLEKNNREEKVLLHEALLSLQNLKMANLQDNKFQLHIDSAIGKMEELIKRKGSDHDNTGRQTHRSEDKGSP
jgi:hypothetical protein